MRDSILTLIKETIQTDSIGNQTMTETSREVFCSVLPITQSEFFSARAIGINPTKRFEVFFDDYEGEEACVFEGQKYIIYRVYDREDDVTELYAQRKLGRNES